jgi:hypothetical protein
VTTPKTFGMPRKQGKRIFNIEGSIHKDPDMAPPMHLVRVRHLAPDFKGKAWWNGKI